jgi:hypothetical protein
MQKIKSFLSLLLILSLFGGAACVKKDDLMPLAQMLMVPLSPDAVPTDFEINNQLFATTVSYSTTVGTTTYGLPYYTVQPGSVTVKYNITGTKNAFASATVNVENETAYSTFLIDSASKTKVAVVKDDVSAPTEGKVKLRFFHFSPNAPALDVTVGASGAKLFSNRSFNDQGSEDLQKFIEVDPGIYQFAFKTAGTNTTLYTTTSLNLQPNRVYTLAARGFVGGTGNRALGGWFYPNRPQ